jgi:hypothetical protein
MDVGEPGGAGPAALLFDEVFPNIVEPNRHRSTGSKGVCADTRRIVAGVEEAGQDDAFPNGPSDVSGADVGAGCHKIDGKGRI